MTIHHCRCEECEAEEATVHVGPAQMLEGHCNACTIDPDGRIPRRKTVNVRLRGLTFRICQQHWREMEDQAERAFKQSAQR
jgi:hypothetical protein